MSSQWPKAGPNHVPSYQTSGIPYVTSSADGTVVLAANEKAPTEVHFPYVTKFVTVNNIGSNDLRVAFTFSGSYAPGEVTTENLTLDVDHPRNYFVIKKQAAGAIPTVTFDIRCKSMFFLADNSGTTGFSLVAGLTTIPAESFPILTGSVTGSATTLYPDGTFPGFEGVG